MVKNNVIKKTEYDELVEEVNAVDAIDVNKLVEKADYDTQHKEIEKKNDLTMINILLLIILINFQA